MRAIPLRRRHSWGWVWLIDVEKRLVLQTLLSGAVPLRGAEQRRTSGSRASRKVVSAPGWASHGDEWVSGGNTLEMTNVSHRAPRAQFPKFQNLVLCWAAATWMLPHPWRVEWANTEDPSHPKPLPASSDIGSVWAALCHQPVSTVGPRWSLRKSGLQVGIHAEKICCLWGRQPLLSWEWLSESPEFSVPSSCRIAFPRVQPFVSAC